MKTSTVALITVAVVAAVGGLALAASASSSGAASLPNQKDKPPSAEDLQRGFRVVDGCDIVALDEPRALAWISELGARPDTSLDFNRSAAFSGCNFWSFKPSLFAYKMLRALFLSAPPSKAAPKFAVSVLADMMARATASGLSTAGWPSLP